MGRQRWFDRVFELGEPLESAPSIIDRLRSAPDRLSAAVEGLSPAIASTRTGASWSIAEHVGHLGDLEPLWYGRVEDLLHGRADLRPADLENAATWAAGHNEKSMDELLGVFRDRRSVLVSKLEQLDARQLSSSAVHPRLREPMSVVDLGFFVAEHDDHHIATIRVLASA